MRFHGNEKGLHARPKERSSDFGFHRGLPLRRIVFGYRWGDDVFTGLFSAVSLHP
jgi:hypothetical protein